MGQCGAVMCLLSPQMFENHRVKFYMQTEVSELREQENKVQHGKGSPGARGGHISPWGCLLHCWAFALSLSLPPEFVFLSLAPRSKCAPATWGGFIALRSWRDRESIEGDPAEALHGFNPVPRKHLQDSLSGL